MKTTHFDDEMRQLADRHYSRRTIGAKQFAYSGRKLVLRDVDGLILWVWMFPDPTVRMDGQTGYNNAIFRNESARLSSDIHSRSRAARDRALGSQPHVHVHRPDEDHVGESGLLLQGRGVAVPALLSRGQTPARQVRLAGRWK